MYDPMTVAFEILYPWLKYGRNARSVFERGYRESFITIWHIDPEDARGMVVRRKDDTCGWFTPPYPPEAQEHIRKLGEQQYSTIFSKQHAVAENKDYARVCYQPSTYDAIYWTWRAIKHAERSGRGWQYGSPLNAKELDYIYSLDANPVDNLRMSVAEVKDAESCASFFVTVYCCYLRFNRPWYKHPRWHFWHWRFQIHPLQKLKRRLFTRCTGCGDSFGWNESPTGEWNGKRVWHSRCYPAMAGTAKVPDSAEAVFRPVAVVRDGEAPSVH